MSDFNVDFLLRVGICHLNAISIQRNKMLKKLSKSKKKKKKFKNSKIATISISTN